LNSKGFYWLACVALTALVVLFASGVLAGETDGKKHLPTTPKTSENLPAPTINTTVSPVNAPTINAASGGGQSSANLYESSDYDSLGLAFGNEAPIPYGATPECYVPGKGLKRGQGWVFGLVQLSAVLERDELCIEDMRAARAHAERMAELRVEQLKAEAAAADAAAGRVANECALNACVTK